MKIFFPVLTFILGSATQLLAQESESFLIEVTPGYYPNEIGWEVSDLLTGEVIFSTGEDSLGCTVALNGGNGAGAFEISLICGSEYQLTTWDTYGDGWNGGELTIKNNNQEVILCTTNSNPDGCFGYINFQAQRASWNSCSDPNACNFNP